MRRRVVHIAATLLLSGFSFAAGQTERPPANKALIEGTVARADSAQPLKGARVTLERATAQPPAMAGGIAAGTIDRLVAVVATVTTDGTGKFLFTGIDPGQYRISAERDGFIRAEYGQRTPTGNGIVLPLSANQHLTIDLKMLQASVISGRVITPDGEPAADATVQAYTYQYSNGQRSLAETKTVLTNDLGEYRLFGLAPVDYFISVDPKNGVVSDIPSGTVDVRDVRANRGIAGIQLQRGNPMLKALGGAINPPIYYPGTLDPDEATPILVPPSSEVRGVDFVLRPVSAATLSGRVAAPFSINQGAIGARGRAFIAGPDGAPLQLQVAGAPIQLNLSRVGESRTGLGGLLNLQLGISPVNPDGTFEVKGVAPGEYNLIATARDPNGQEYTARTRVHVGSSDISNLALSLRPGVEVRGRVLLETTPPEQFRMINLRVNLVSDDGASGKSYFALNVGGADMVRTALVPGQATASAEVAEDGSFVLRDVGAMEYRVQITGLPQGAYIQSGRVDSTDALSGPFSIDQQATMQLQLGFSPGRVSGSVTDERGVAARGAQAVLVPDETRRGRSDSYFAATTDQDGRFTLNNVPPGRYKVFAWEEVPAGAYQYPNFIRRYEDRGQAVSVNPNGAVSADVRVIAAN